MGFGVPFFSDLPKSSDFHSCVSQSGHCSSGTRNSLEGEGNTVYWTVPCACFFAHVNCQPAKTPSDFLVLSPSGHMSRASLNRFDLCFGMFWFLNNAACYWGVSDDAGACSGWSAPNFCVGHRRQHDPSQDHDTEIWSAVHSGRATASSASCIAIADEIFINLQSVRCFALSLW